MLRCTPLPKQRLLPLPDMQKLRPLASATRPLAFKKASGCKFCCDLSHFSLLNVPAFHLKDFLHFHYLKSPLSVNKPL